MNREHIKYAIIGIAIILSAYLLGRAYTYKYRSQDTVVVTGLGETEFESDLIVWSGVLTAEAAEAADGYRRIEQSKRKVSDYLAAKGIDAKQVVWNFVNVDKTYQTVYSANGNYAGQRFTGYSLRQEFSIESTDVDLVENVSREISALIAQGVSIEFVGKIIYHPCLYHPAGFCQRADTRFLVIHPQKHLECLVYHFFPVGNHIGLSFFMFLVAKVRFLF